MPDIMTALKAEIVRLARKETKAAIDPIRKSAAATRSALADLKRRVDNLEKQVTLLCASAPKAPRPETEPESSRSRRGFSGKGVRKLRQKLGLSQQQLAKLLGVGHNSVCKWESRPGVLPLRDRTKAALMAVRGMGSREANKRLEALGEEKEP